MINKGMSEQDLIELVQSQLPQDLTGAQIEQLRKTMRTSPELREVLLEEIRLEHGLSARLAPQKMDTDEFIRKIENQVAFRRRSRFLWSIIFLVCGISMIAGAVGVAYSLRDKPEDLVTKDGVDKDVAGKDLDADKDSQPVKDGTTVINSGKGDKALNTDGKDGSKPDVGNGEVVKPLPPLKPFAPPWKLFDDPAARGDVRWMATAEEIFKPIGNAYHRVDERQGFIDIGGKFTWPVPTDAGQTLRFRVSDMQSFEINLWNGTEGVRIERNKQNRDRLQAMVVKRRDEGERLHGLPDGLDAKFKREQMVQRVDQKIDFSWASKPPSSQIPRENFAVYWTGVITVPKDGEYKFTLRSDDGVAMGVDGKSILNAWGDRAAADTTGTVQLKAGQHDVAIQYYQGLSDAEVRFYWEGPGIKRQIVPTSVLRSSREKDAKPGLLGKYVFGKATGSDEPLNYQLASQDYGTWQSLRHGMLDLRYQDGQIVLARGNVPILTAPMSQEPTHATLETRSRLRFAEVVRLKPLALRDANPGSAPVIVSTTAPSKIDWRMDPISLTADAEQRKRYEDEIAKLEAQLAADSPQLMKAMAAWEKTIDTPWQVLPIRSAQTSSKSEAKVKIDGSVLIEGENPHHDVYQVTARVRLKKITGLRLDVLPDPSFENNGPGRAGGNFVLTGVHIQTATMAKPADILAVKSVTPIASFVQPGWTVEGLIDGKDETGWSVWPRAGKVSSVVFPLEAAIEGDGEVILHVTLEQKSKNGGHNIGHFRLAVTDAEQPEVTSPVLDEALADALRTPREERTADQIKQLLDYYRERSDMLEPLRQRIAEVKKTLEQNHPVIARLAHHQDGSVELIRVNEKRPEKVSAIIDLPVLPKSQSDLDNGGATVVTFEVSEASSYTTVFAGQAVGNHHRPEVAFVERGGKMVVCPYPQDGGHVTRSAEDGFFLGDGCFIRFTYQSEAVTAEFSRHGKRWSHIWSSTYNERHPGTANAPVGLSFYGYKDGPRNIRLKSVKIERLNALEKLADLELVKKVPAIKVADPLKEVDADKEYQALLDAKPRKVGDSDWRRAVAVAVFNGKSTSKTRRMALLDLIDHAANTINDPKLFIAALHELPRRGRFYGDANSPSSWFAVLKAVDQFAQRLWNTDQRDALKDLLDTWYTIDMGYDGHSYYPKDTAPPSLVRLLAYHLIDQKDWRALRLLAMQHDFMNTHSYGHRADDRNTHKLSSLLDWANQTASGRLDDGPDEVEVMGRNAPGRKQVRWASHPLVVESDRETLNAVAEFIASVDAGAYAYACETLTRQALPDGIAPVDPESQLLMSTHVLVRDMIDRDPKLAATLKTKYEKIGLIRLQQVLRDGRFQELAPIATQFHGTEAASEALRHLGDRELSVGNFFAAAGRFDALLNRATNLDETDRAVLQAKRRLAMAMAGEAGGEPVTTDVELGGEVMSARQFERLISTLVEERRSGRVAHGSGHNDVSLAPSPRTLTVSAIRDLATSRDLDNQKRIREIAWVVADGKLIVHQHGRLLAIDLSNRKTIWQVEHSARHLPSYIGSPATPFVHDGQVFVPMFNDRKFEMTCVTLDKGESRWKQQYDQFILGDAVVIGPWLYVLTIQEQLGDYADIVLRRIAPDTGESVLSQRVVRVRFGESAFRVGKPTLVGDALVFRVGNSLICCDLLGSPRWVRQLSFVPPAADAPLFDFQDVNEFAVDGDNLIATCPGSPHVICVNVNTGEQVWSRMQPRLRRLVGIAGGNVIVSSVRFLEALDAKTGKPAWLVPHDGDYDSVLIAQKERVVTISLDKKNNQKNPRDKDALRQIQWLEGKDGSVVRRVDIDAHTDQLYDVEKLISDGKVIIGLSNVSRSNRDQKAKLIYFHAP